MNMFISLVIIIFVIVISKSDRLPDGRILVSFNSLPIDENINLYPKDHRKHMLLNGGFLFTQQTVEIEQLPGRNNSTNFIAKSQVHAEDILLQSAAKSTLSNNMTSFYWNDLFDNCK